MTGQAIVSQQQRDADVDSGLDAGDQINRKFDAGRGTQKRQSCGHAGITFIQARCPMTAIQSNFSQPSFTTDPIPALLAPKHRTALTALLISGLVLFTGLLAAYGIFRADTPLPMPALPWIFWPSTAVLVLASLTLWYSVRSVWAFDGIRAHRSLLAATAMVYLFLGLQAPGLVMLGQLNLPFTFTSSTLYGITIALVALNLAQVIGGAIVLSWAALRSEKRHYEGKDITMLRPLAVFFYVATAAWVVAFAGIVIVNW